MAATGGFDATDAGADLSPLVNQIIAKLNEACGGAPINVQVCNPLDISGLQTSLTAIQASVAAVDANTNTVEALLATINTSLAGLDSDDDATALASILTGVNNAITELQAIDANTDGIEAALASIVTSIVAEGDQTQALLTTLNTAIAAIQTKLNETCAGSPINVSVCPTPQVDQTHVIVHGQNSSVPAGLKSVIINNLSGVTTVDGVFELGDGRRANAISYNATELSEVRGLLPAIALAGGTFQWSGIQPIAEV